jgi:tRNA (cmo5U34)-methyltransferase
MKQDVGYTAPCWVFDDEITRVFPDMLERSIPGYRSMREVVTRTATKYAAKNGCIVDLGVARGDALMPVVMECLANNTYCGYDVSEPMLDAARESFGSLSPEGIVTIERHDLREGLPEGDTWTVALSVLTLMFVPIEYRQQILADIYDRLDNGGAFILVEKVLGDDASLNTRLVEMYYDIKRQNGYDDDSIDRKRLALEGVLVSLRASENERMVRSAGFEQVECIWRYLNFAGWVAVKCPTR